MPYLMCVCHSVCFIANIFRRHLVSRYESSSIALSSLPLNASALAESYVEVSRPLVGQMTPDNYDSTYRHRPLLVAYYDVNWDREEVKGI